MRRAPATLANQKLEWVFGAHRGTIATGTPASSGMLPAHHESGWLEEIRPIRDEIRERVNTLIEKLASM